MFNNLSFKYKLLVTFLAFYLIPLIIISSLGYSLLVSSMERQTLNGYQTVLDNTGMQMDNALNSLEAYNMDLLQKPWVLSLQNLQSEYPKRYDPYDIRKFSDELRGYVSVSKFAKDVIIYFPKSNKIISSLSSNLEEVDFFTQRIFSSDQMQRLINTGFSSAQCVVLENTFNYEREMKGVLIAYPMAINKKGSIDEGCIIAYFISNATLEEILSVNLSGSAFVMQDETIISKNGITDEQITSLIKIYDEEVPSLKKTVKTVKMDGSQCYLLSSQSENSQWTYYHLLQSGKVAEGSTTVKWVFICGLIIFSLLGFCCSLYIAIKNYRPLEQIIQKLNENAKATDPAVNVDSKQIQESAIVHNEFSWLDAAVKSLMDKDRNLRMQVEEQRPLLRNSYLMWLLKDSGMKDEQAVKTSLQHLDIFLNEPWFNVMVWLKLQAQVYHRRVEEMAASHNLSVQCLDTQEKTIWIINYALPHMLDEFCAELENDLTAAAKPCAVGIGVSVYGVTALCLPCTQADFALNFASINNQRGLILFSSITSLSGGYYYPLDKEASIRNHLKAGEFNKAFEIFAEVAAYNFKSKPVSLERMRNFFRNAQSTCIKVADELGMHFEFNLQPEQITDISSLESCEGDMREAYQAICFYALENLRLPDLVLKEQISSYAEKMLTNPKISLSTIAEEFELSVSYVSKLFKQHMDSNFLDYINRARIKLAKEMLLEDEKLEIYEIARRVGYENDTTFRRIFKKYEGVTPVQFRLINKDI